MYPSQVMKLTSLSEMQHEAQKGPITYLNQEYKMKLNKSETFCRYFSYMYNQTYMRKNGSQQKTKTPVKKKRDYE